MILIAVSCVLRLNYPLIRQFPKLFYYCLSLPLVVVDLNKSSLCIFSFYFLLRFAFIFYTRYLQKQPNRACYQKVCTKINTNFLCLVVELLIKEEKKEGQNRPFYCCGFRFRPRPDVELFGRRTISVDLLSTTGTYSRTQ